MNGDITERDAVPSMVDIIQSSHRLEMKSAQQAELTALTQAHHLDEDPGANVYTESHVHLVWP